jgi:hypothetical protein
MKSLSGVLLFCFALAHPAFAFEPPAQQPDQQPEGEPTLQCDVTMFSKTLSPATSCGRILFDRTRYSYSGVGDCPNLAAEFISTNSKSGVAVMGS